ncbi:MAG TPA: hypothetical protein VFN37_07130 [Candidatus Baltobacteraceae bacterium]|nr:hypothetical protein [Candidatus Baltobacteraceae bacterium]
MSVIEKPVSSVDAAVVAHYQLVAPVLEQLFGAIPLVWATYPYGLDAPGQYHVHYFGHWTNLSAQHIERLVGIGALEFYSWTPTAADPARARFARFLLERPTSGDAGDLDDQIGRGACALREVLRKDGHDGIPVLDGAGGISIFVPLSNAPAYDDVRAWCHAIAAKAIAQNADLLSAAPNTVADARAHVHVSSNAVNLFSMLPYSFRAKTGRVATPVTWEELDGVDLFGEPIATFASRLQAAGEVFGEMLGRIHARALDGAPRALTEAVVPLPHGRRPHKHRHGEMVSTVAQILSDGKSRTPAEIWKIARERHLPCSDTVGDLSSNVWAYIERQTAHGLKPVVVPTDDHKFRINEPPDAWPDDAPHATQPGVDLDALIARLTQAASDSQNPANFEIAVCDAFAALGLLTTHVGGLGAPDGYADAPLGTMGYRVMFECKSGTTLQKSPNIFEASKFKDAYRAKYCTLIGSQSGTEQQEALSEIKTHGVSLWGADDIVFALRARLTPLDLEPAFAPGAVAQEVLPDIVWARDHGQAKRVRIIAEIVRSAGWTTQCAAAQANTPADAPLLTEDAAMLLVDQELAAQGAHVNCTREEVHLAFEWLTSPLRGAAVWNAEKTAIVVVRTNIG